MGYTSGLVKPRRVHPLLRFARAYLLRDVPVYVHYAVSSRCDLRCRSCSIWRRDPPVPELSAGQVDRLAGVLADLGCMQVSLGGGEPSLRPDLVDLVRSFRRRGIRTRVLTNGVALTPQRARRLLDVGVREVSFSLNSLDPGRQERLDGVRGTFGRRLDNLLALAAMLPRRGVLPVLNVVVSRQNVGQIHQLLDFAHEIGFFASFIPVHTAEDHADGDRHRFYGEGRSLRFSDRQQRGLRGVYRRLIRRKRLGARVLNSTAFLRRSPDYLLTGRAEWPCSAGRLWLSVAPDGSVSPCHAFEGSWGVPFDRLPELLRSDAYAKRLAQQVPACEGCFRPCWAEVGLMFASPASLVEMARNQVLAQMPRPRFDAAAVRRRFGPVGSR